MHSTIFFSLRRFIDITIKYYLPYFTFVFLFYYIINIPSLVPFASLYQSQKETFYTLGFYQFTLPSLEVFLHMLILSPFFMLIQTKKYLEYNKEETKRKFLERLTDKESPLLYYLAFWVFNNLEMVVFITIFFSGVNKIDFYHIFLMFFFVVYILNPAQFKGKYIILLYYVDFFVFEK